MRGATGGQCIHQVDGNISIHAPHAGRDDNPAFRRRINQLFQSTRPMRGATFRKAHDGLVIGISIHAPHAGRDPDLPDCRRLPCDFNPRAPCGARRCDLHPLTCGSFAEIHTRPMRGATVRPGFSCRWLDLFQSTRPMRGATRIGHGGLSHGRISIHAPHAGRDPWRMSVISTAASNFNPRAPCGARRKPKPVQSGALNFNPRAPCGARQQKYTKLLYTLLRQKAILRQFHAKRCLSKRFAACRSAKTSLFAVRTAAEISASFCFAL